MRNQLGQTLIEVLVALGIGLTILAAISSIVLSSLNNTTFSKNENLATSYAKQVLENVRQQVKSNYTTFTNTYTSPTYCLDANDTFQCSFSQQGQCISTYSGNCNNVKSDIFVKQIDFIQGSVDCPSSLQATVQVSWTDNKCTDRLNIFCHKVIVSSCFADITTVPSPL